MSTISVVIPMYNEEDRIEACLQALIDQTHPVDEIIVVDNMSTDGSSSLVLKMAKSYPVITLMTEESPGCFAARSAGYDAAQGDIIARTDADTHVAPDWAERIVSFLDSDAGQQFDAMGGLTRLYDAPPFGLIERLSVKAPRGLENGGQIGSITGHNHAMRRLAWKTIRESVTPRQDVWEGLDMGLALTEEGLRIYFDPQMQVASSIRALRKSPISSWWYITGIVRTAKARNNKAAIRIAYAEVPVRFVLFTGMWILFRPWDQPTKTWNPIRLLQPLNDDHWDVTKAR